MTTRTTHRARRLAAALVAIVSLTGLAACSSGQGSGSGQGKGKSGSEADGATRMDGGDLAKQIEALPLATLTPAEEAGLLQMREEEKLAYDVYMTLYEKWGLKPFSNISGAEQTHSDAVKLLLDRYSLSDPAAGNATGVFTNPDLQALYTSLVTQGDTSLVDALTVGASIEDLDIADLQSLATATPDIQLVYDNLERGSRNHMRAFTKQLANNDATYTPTHISQADYDAIIAGDMEQGSGG